MKLGFSAPVSGAWARPDTMLHISRRAEELGYESLWTFQRLLTSAGRDWPEASRSVHDPIVALSYIAGHTSRIRLGLGVVNVPLFSPALLAKQVTTVDIVSGGRIDVGLGLGWSHDEFVASGTGYARRGARSEEFIAALRTLWTQDVAVFRGEFYEIPPARMEPKPIQRPHPPILLGAAAEPALRRIGRLADGWISSLGVDPGRIGEQISIIRDAAVRAGRDPDALRFICRGLVRLGATGGRGRRTLTGSPEEIRGDFTVLRDQGVTELFVDLNYDSTIGSPDADADLAVERAEETLEALAPAPSTGDHGPSDHLGVPGELRL